MSQPYEPYPVQPEQPPGTGHAPGYGAANPYYAPHDVGQPRELTLTAILAAGSALALAACAVVQAAVVGDAVRTTDPTDLSYLVYGGSSLLYLLLLVASYVATCLWLWRARQNSELLGPGHHHARSRGWVWGGWVCPIVNLWFPFQVVKGVHLASTRGF